MDRLGGKTLLLVSWLYWLGLAMEANMRTIESPFALSSDARSEFGASFQVFSAGRIVVEGSWNAEQGGAYPLHIAVVRPRRKRGGAPRRQ
jgi:hypothetical protein